MPCTGTLRLFAIPGFEGDVRVVTVVDEMAATEVLAQIGHAAMLGNAGALVCCGRNLCVSHLWLQPSCFAGLQRKRLSEFLHAAAASPSAAKWPTTSEALARRSFKLLQHVAA